MNQNISVVQTARRVRLLAPWQGEAPFVVRQCLDTRMTIQNGVSQREVSLDGMDGLGGRTNHSMIEPTRSFARIAQTREQKCAARAPDQGGPQQPLEIQRQVRPSSDHCAPQPLPHSPSPAPSLELPAWKFNHLVHDRVASEERHPFRVRNPRDLALWPSLLQPRHRWQGMHDVAERTRLDDEQRAGPFDLQSIISRLPSDLRDASASRQRESSSARCGCRIPDGVVR